MPYTIRKGKKPASLHPTFLCCLQPNTRTYQQENDWQPLFVHRAACDRQYSYQDLSVQQARNDLENKSLDQTQWTKEAHEAKYYSSSQ